MRRSTKVAAVIGLALMSVGVGCTFVAGVGDYAVGDAGSSRRGDAGLDAKRNDDGPSHRDVKGGEDAPASHDAGTDVTPEPDATGPAACGILDASAPIDLCTDAGTVTPQPLTTFPSASAVVAIVAEGATVFWTDGAAIWRFLQVDAAPQLTQFYPLFVDGGTAGVISDIALDTSNLYFSGNAGLFGSSNVGACSRSDGCELTGGSFYGVATTRATSVDSDDMSVFWTDDAGLHACPIGGCSQDGGTTNIATGKPAPGPIALGSMYADWVDLEVGAIVHTAKDDSLSSMDTPKSRVVSESFVPTATGTSQLVTTTIGLFWATPFQLNLCPTTDLQSATTCVGGATRVGPVFAAPPTVCSATSKTNIPIVTDNVNIYYVAPVAAGASCSGGAALVKCSQQGACSVLATGLQEGIGAIAADARNVYWGEIRNQVASIMYVPHS